MTIFKVAAASSVYTVRDDFKTAETGVENVRHPLFGERRKLLLTEKCMPAKKSAAIKVKIFPRW